MSADPEFKRSETRFYVIVGAIVVLALAGFFFLSTVGITGASTFDSNNEQVTASVGNSESDSLFGSKNALAGGTAQEDIADENSVKSKNTAQNKKLIADSDVADTFTGLDLDLSLDAYPNIKKETTIDQVEIEFLDLNTNLNINKERLELNSLQGIRLNLNGFAGKVYLTEQGLSLDGTVNKVEVNGVALSSEAMRVAFEGLDYRYLYLGGIDLNEVQFAGGAGKLVTKDEKVVYSLDSRDKIALSQFWGDLTVDKNAEAPLLVKGEAQKLQISGDLELSLQ
jgi:hypothetical protein